jgi:polygalacturonase
MNDLCVIDARDFGLKADGVTDDLPALNAALAAFPFDGLHYQFGGKLLLPSGNILLSDTWLIDRIVDVCGVTGHSNELVTSRGYSG